MVVDFYLKSRTPGYAAPKIEVLESGYAGFGQVSGNRKGPANILDTENMKGKGIDRAGRCRILVPGQG